MKRVFLYLLFFCILFPLATYSQIKFKPQLEGATGFANDNFSLLNFGLGLEKKIDVNKSIETGIYYHNFDFNFPKTKYGFYEAFIRGTSDDVYQDSINTYKVMFNFLAIPIGYNHYISPKTYVGYKLGLNFFSSSTYQGLHVSPIDDTEEQMIYKTRFSNSIFKKFYVNHNISINTIILRRIDLGLSFIFTKSDFFKKLDNEVYRSFNKEVSSYFAVGLSMKIFVFQINSNRI
jgi:hypothetical protein